MGFLATSSSIGIFIAGLTIMICWSMASGDDIFINEHCGGCIRLFHKVIWENDAYSFYRSSKDPVALLLTFGVLCGVSWIATSITVIAKPRYYLTSGIITTIIFICSFVPILERMRRNQMCILHAKLTEATDIEKSWSDNCRKDEDWQLKHMYDSYQMFWASSVVCFFIAGYQIACGIALTYEDEMKDECKEKHNDDLLLLSEVNKPNPNEDLAKNLHGQVKESKESLIDKSGIFEYNKSNEVQGMSAHKSNEEHYVEPIEQPQEELNPSQDNIIQEDIKKGADEEETKKEEIKEEEVKEQETKKEEENSIVRSEEEVDVSINQLPPEGSPVPEVDIADFSLSNN